MVDKHIPRIFPVAPSPSFYIRYKDLQKPPPHPSSSSSLHEAPPLRAAAAAGNSGSPSTQLTHHGFPRKERSDNKNREKEEGRSRSRSISSLMPISIVGCPQGGQGGREGERRKMFCLARNWQGREGRKEKEISWGNCCAWGKEGNFLILMGGGGEFLRIRLLWRNNNKGRGINGVRTRFPTYNSEFLCRPKVRWHRTFSLGVKKQFEIKKIKIFLFF